jgi:hypothetical protein
LFLMSPVIITFVLESRGRDCHIDAGDQERMR